MKRILTLVLAVLLLASMTLGFSSCGKKSDWEAVKEKGYFVCGITVYEPMNYFDEDGNLVGFDTEFAQAVAKELGLEAKFQVISWPNKYIELNGGAIDLIWNGFTYGLESDGVSRTEYVDFTHAYLENRQCLITKADRVAELNTAEAFKGLKGVAEGGSSGQGVAEELAGDAKKITTFTSQAAALMELVAGTADFAVIDYQMAKAMVGVGDYASLAINEAVKPESEVYAIGCRKGSDLTAKINEAIEKLSQDGTLAALAEKYGLTNDLIANIGKN
ncbi:MAG: transporter substrate-binding domain-containing protein [Clostridia bacterium]|nr:transporter substrate-binding domain-containing protein [Clostridia bacterium]